MSSELKSLSGQRDDIGTYLGTGLNFGSPAQVVVYIWTAFGRASDEVEPTPNRKTHKPWKPGSRVEASAGLLCNGDTHSTLFTTFHHSLSQRPRVPITSHQILHADQSDMIFQRRRFRIRIGLSWTQRVSSFVREAEA